MRGMKGKLLKKMKSIGTVGYLKIQDRVLQVSTSDGYYPDSCPKNSDFQIQNKILRCEEPEQKKKINQSCLTEQEPEVIDVADLMKGLEEDEEEDMEMDEDTDDKENIGPPMRFLKPNQEISLRRISEASELLAPEPENRRQVPLSEMDMSSFRRPDLNSYSLFDPNLLDAFKQAVMDHMRMSEAERRMENEKLFENIVEEEEEEDDEEEEEEQEPPSKAPRVEIEQEEDPLLQFDEKCPPGGADSVILYTTTLRGIRKTFEGCNSVRFLLESFRVAYFERDVSMHSEFREELRTILDGKAVPPMLFIRGRYIGGAEEVLGLHEQGRLRPLFKTVPIDRSNGPCEGCAGMRFVLCFNCNGSHKVVAENGQCNNCSICNENGLIICPICC